MTATPYSNALEFARTGCQILAFPPVAAELDQDAQALAILRAWFTNPQRWGDVVGEVAASPLDETYHRTGVSGEGWPWVELRGELRTPGLVRSGERVRVLLANLGSQAVAIVGWQDRAGCLDEVLDPYEWIQLTYSLGFPGYQGDAAALGRALVGGWFGSSSASLAWSDVFAANGEHSDLYGVQTYRQLSPTLIQETFSAWQGTGRWAVHGDQLTVWPDDAARPPRTTYFRVAAEHGGFTYLYRLGQCGASLCERWSTKD